MKAKLTIELNSILPNLGSSIRIETCKCGTIKDKKFIWIQNLWVIEIHLDTSWIKEHVTNLLHVEQMFYFKKNLETQLIPLTMLF